jgi:hypothetical protein
LSLICIANDAQPEQINTSYRTTYVSIATGLLQDISDNNTTGKVSDIASSMEQSSQQYRARYESMQQQQHQPINVTSAGAQAQCGLVSANDCKCLQY